MTDHLKLFRQNLATIDLSDVVEMDEMSPSERAAYCGAIFAVWPRLEKDIKDAMFAQIMYNSKHADNWEQVIFGRGVIDGFAQLHARWEKAATEHQERATEGKEQIDPHNPINQI